MAKISAREISDLKKRLEVVEKDLKFHSSQVSSLNEHLVRQ